MPSPRSSSPKPKGGSTTPGLTEYKVNSHTATALNYTGMNGYASNDAQWAAAKARSAQVRGYPHIQSCNEGFFQRSKRRISSVLPRYNSLGQNKNDWKNTEKLGRGRWTSRESMLSQLKTLAGNVLRRFKFLFILLAFMLAITLLMSQTSE